MAINYTNASTLAITSASGLASINTTASAAACSVARVTPTTNNLVDQMVTVKVIGPATMTASASTTLNIYAYGASYDGSNYQYAGGNTTNELIDGTDKALTLHANGHNLKFLGTILMHTTSSGTSVTYVSEPMSIASAFGGIMPKAWGIVVQNAAPASASLPTGTPVTVYYTDIYYS